MRKVTESGWPEASKYAHIVYFLFCTMAAAPAFASEPSYEETVAFIEANVARAFVERSHCNFIYGDNLRFSVQSLNPIPKVSIRNVVFMCAQSKLCIDPRNSDKLAAQVGIEVRDAKNASKVTKAMAHLIGLCGGSKVKTDLFN